MATIKAITVASKTKTFDDPEVIYCGQDADAARAAVSSAGESGYAVAGVIMHGQTIGNRFFEVAPTIRAEAVEADSAPTRRKKRSSSY